ncbi:MAG: caspase family protein [Muribaculaceae bacterium]|nr:caspase family protein [Muribaculaceae bacterium]
MKKLLALISVLVISMTVSVHSANVLSHDKNIEKQLKKLYKTVSYMPHADCYLVTSKKAPDGSGVCDLQAREVVPPVYKKISFERTESGETLILCEKPNSYASQRGNKVYSLSKGEIINLGTSEPWYIDGGYLSSYGKPVYNLSGNIVLECETSAVQPVRHGAKIIAYRVNTRSIINGAAKDQLWFCDETFNRLFVLDGQAYLWQTEESVDSDGRRIWLCTANDWEKGKYTLRYSADGTLLDSEPAANDNMLAEAVPEPQPEPKPTPKPHSKPTASTPAKNTPAAGQKPVASGKSDVDINPPKTDKVAENTFAVIIANENYSEVEDVPFALNDGTSMDTYCKRTLGIPESNVRFIRNATLNQMKRQLRWLNQIAEAYGKDAKIIFYYSGHGMPDEASKEAYLLPVDGYYADMSTNLAVNELYSSLSALNVEQVTVFMDACFSGSQRSDQMLVSARGVKIKARTDRPKGNLVVMSAAQATETAYPYHEKQHGMFTYFLLKKLKESGSAVNLGELGDYIIDKVKKTSLIQNDKIQTPSLAISPLLEDSWRNKPLN